jgi:hypothetical protein
VSSEWAFTRRCERVPRMLSLSALGCSGGSESLSSMSRMEVGVMGPLLFVPLPLPPRGTRCSPRWSTVPSRLPVPRNPRLVAVGVESVSARSSEEKRGRERRVRETVFQRFGFHFHKLRQVFLLKWLQFHMWLTVMWVRYINDHTTCYMPTIPSHYGTMSRLKCT